MGKGEKNSLGRALVKHHHQMVQESKEKGRFYRNQHKKVLESVTEISDIDAVIQQADEAHRIFTALNPPVNLAINLDPSSSTSEMTLAQRRKQQKKEEALHASSLRIPRRPAWNSKMSVEELDYNENEAFLEWRRSLARLEENENLILTPFEKNLDIWRQLWRVLERSDLLVMVVDARDPLFYRCPDLEAYAREIDEHKKTMLLVNKADLLPLPVRERWAEYFHQHGILFVFWSARAATAILEGKPLDLSPGIQSNKQGSADIDTKIYGRDELLTRLQSEAEEIVSMRLTSQSKSLHSDDNVLRRTPAQTVVVGFVGYPNVGKSSTINALVGEKKTGVTSTPGKTKHFQTLIISEKLTLCDCPGLVFPSFTSSRFEMIASGVLPVDRMSEHREAVQVVANRVPRSVIEEVYKISLPKPKTYETQSRAPLAAEIFRAYCASRGYVASSGLPDETKAARQILKDYIDGKIPHYKMPPEMTDNLDDDVDDDDKDDEDDDDIEVTDSDDEEISSSIGESDNGPHLERVLSDLNSFDLDNGLAASKSAPARRKVVSSAPHKQHKKPQRKKDRSWRAKNNDGDGMPVVRVFQKPVNVGQLNV